MLISGLLFVLLKCLCGFNCEKNSIESNRINVLNHIVGMANENQPIDTIAYFGDRDALDPFISEMMSGTPKIIMTQNFGQFDIKFNVNFNNKIFFLSIGSVESSANFQFIYDTFTSMQSRVKGVFIFPSKKGLMERFDWCWRKGFLKVIALIENNNDRSWPYKMYTYTPFPTLSVVELLQNESSKYFDSKLDDLGGYKLRTAVLYDPPRVFTKTNPLNPNQTTYLGYAARIYLEFLKYHNAELDVVRHRKSNTYNILSVIDDLNQGSVDLTMNPFLPYPGTSTSYPLIMIRMCILVPASGEIKGYMYFLLPFQLNTWLMLLAVLVYLSFLRALNEFIGKKLKFSDHRHIDVGHSFTEVLRTMLFLPIPNASRDHCWHYALSHLLVAVFGFIISNIYLAVLTSFLSKIIFQKQVDTLFEMVQQNMSLHAVDYEIPIILRNQGLPKGFADLLVSRNVSELVKDLFAMRLGHAYVAREDTINFVLKQQNNLRHPKFHMAQECITTMPVGYLMPSHSQYKNELDLFTLQTAAAGLIERFFHLTVLDGFRAGVLANEFEKADFTIALTLEYFQFAFIVILNGLLLSAVVFVLEQLSRLRIHISLGWN